MLQKKMTLKIYVDKNVTWIFLFQFVSLFIFLRIEPTIYLFIWIKILLI